MKKREKETLLREPGEEELMEVSGQLFFQWKQVVRKYKRMGQR
jgi:hypothetical protein